MLEFARMLLVVILFSTHISRARLSRSFFSTSVDGAFDQRSAFLRAAAWLIASAPRLAPSWPDTHFDPAFSTPHSSLLSHLLSMSRGRQRLFRPRLLESVLDVSRAALTSVVCERCLFLRLSRSTPPFSRGFRRPSRRCTTQQPLFSVFAQSRAARLTSRRLDVILHEKFFTS